MSTWSRNGIYDNYENRVQNPAHRSNTTPAQNTRSHNISAGAGTFIQSDFEKQFVFHESFLKKEYSIGFSEVYERVNNIELNLKMKASKALTAIMKNAYDKLPEPIYERKLPLLLLTLTFIPFIASLASMYDSR
jgi:hypothetical protein